MRKSGLFLLAFGLVFTLFSEFNPFTKDKVADIGKIEITQNKPHQVDWSPVVGISIMAVGAAFYLFGKRTTKFLHVVK